jgi:hypothetical protein
VGSVSLTSINVGPMPLLKQLLYRIMIGFNGTSAAATTDRSTNPKLQDVNIGWLQKIRTNAADRNVDSDWCSW